jgi:Fe-S-cluster containining protein
MREVRSLTIHADYQCRHAGECCRAGWPIPTDPQLKTELDRAIQEGRLVIPVRLVAADACRYYEGDRSNGSGRCAIHRQLGETRKPSSCRHFPRIALLDPRGVSITLSHYCPTAASMLFRSDVPLGITNTPASFPSTGVYEGLDARDVLPPLLRPGLLWDYEGYTAWERHAVTLLASPDVTPEEALEWLRRIAAAIEQWDPAHGPLAAHVARSFASVARGPRALSAWGVNAAVVNRYLAARLFASWVPFSSACLTALIQDLARTHALLQARASREGVDLLEAFRANDLRVVHAGC